MGSLCALGKKGTSCAPDCGASFGAVSGTSGAADGRACLQPLHIHYKEGADSLRAPWDS